MSLSYPSPSINPQPAKFNFIFISTNLLLRRISNFISTHGCFLPLLFLLTATSIVSICIVNLLNCYALGLFLLRSKQTIDGVENGVPIERMPVAEGHELCVYSSNSFSIHHINWIINNNSNLGIDSFIVRMCPQWLRVRICNRI